MLEILDAIQKDQCSRSLWRRSSSFRMMTIPEEFYTINGIRECRFATVGDLKSALWKAHIEPKRHMTELHELGKGRGVRLSVSEAQRNAFFR